MPSGVRDKIGRLLATYLLAPLAAQGAQGAPAPTAWGRRGGSPVKALTDAMTDLVFRWPARRFAEEHRGRTHVYEFEWRSPLFGGQLGAAHAMEVPFVFDTLPVASGEDRALRPERRHRRSRTAFTGLWVGFRARRIAALARHSRATARHVHRLAADRTDRGTPDAGGPFPALTTCRSANRHNADRHSRPIPFR